MNDVADDQTISRRERLKQEREERILEAAAAVFSHKGFHRATIREIAELADVADGTIYNYFADKRDLLVAIARRAIAGSTSEALAEFQFEDDEAFLTAILRDRFDFASRNLDFTRVLLAQAWTDKSFRHQYLGEVIAPLLQVMEGYLNSRIEAGTMRPVNTEVVIRAMAGGFLIFLMLSEPGGERLYPSVPRKELVDALVDFFMHGLQAQPGQGGSEGG